MARMGLGGRQAAAGYMDPRSGYNLPSSQHSSQHSAYQQYALPVLPQLYIEPATCSIRQAAQVGSGAAALQAPRKLTARRGLEPIDSDAASPHQSVATFCKAV